MKHQLPPLPYSVSALAPHIDARTLTLHHDKHHAGYVDALNRALEAAPESLLGKSAEWLLQNLDQVPENIRTAVHHNAGGHANHSLFWQVMTPGGEPLPEPLAEAIDDSFDSFEKFKTQFEGAGSRLFGSGWVWLVKPAHGGKLQVMTTEGHDNPVMEDCVPLLVNDVWEHAYYLKYENRRPEYLQGWWAVTNWKEAARRLTSAQHADMIMSAKAHRPESRPGPF